MADIMTDVFKLIRIRRGKQASLPASDAQKAGELKYAHDTKRLYIDDGTTNVLLADPENTLKKDFVDTIVTDTTTQKHSSGFSIRKLLADPSNPATAGWVDDSVIESDGVIDIDYEEGLDGVKHIKFGISVIDGGTFSSI